MKMSETSPTHQVSYFTLILIIVTIILSIFMLYQGIEAYLARSDWSYLLILGIVMLAFSIYMFFQSRKSALKSPSGTQRVISTIICKKCGFKNIRDFQLGDYIFKEVEPCPKCNDKMVIASIYREVKDTEKGI